MIREIRKASSLCWHRGLALTMMAALLLGPCGAEARVIPTIYIPKETVRVMKIKCNDSRAEGKFVYVSPEQLFGRASPALVGSPTFSSGNKKVTAWGMGWFSENDQTIQVNQNRSITWTDGVGNQATFSETNGSTTTVPVYTVPSGMYVSLAAASHVDGVPTAISERDKDGTTRLFEVAESTSTLRLTRLTDRNGNTITYTRDSQGRLTRAIDIHGRYFELTYSTSGFVSALSDSGGRTTTYTYDGLGRRIGENGPPGATAYAYDEENRLTRVTYPNGGVKNYAYDTHGRLASEDDGNGANRLTYTYFTSSKTITDALGRTTVEEYTTVQGIKTASRVIDPSGGMTSFTYDGNLNLLTQTDPLGRVTRYTYDSQGNVTETQDAAGGRTLASYELTFNQFTSLTDPLNRMTLMTYDSKGNLTRIEDPLSHFTNKSYDSFGHVVQNRDPLGLSINFTYEPTNGALASVTDPLSRTTAMQTDALSRVTRNTDPLGKVTQYAYDSAGNLTRVTDSAGNVTEYAYSPGRKAMVLSSVKDVLNRTTTFGYDTQGRLNSVTNALGQTKTSEYDAKGNLTRTVNARGQEITYAYNSRDRLTTKTLPEGTISYSYDAAGNLTRVSHYNGGVVEMTYDSLNRMTQSKQTLPGGYQAAIGYSYDANGNRTQMTTPWGNFSYEYDALNRLTKITNPQSKEFTFTYDAAGRRTSLTYPNGIETIHIYDDAGQTLSINHHRTLDQAVIAFSSYTYDAAGNRTSMEDIAGTHSYGYDDLDRLTSATHPAASHVPTKNEVFNYDGVGNRLADANITGYVYDAANRLLENSSFTYSYDADGNQTFKTERETNKTTTYAYDSQNTLAGTTLPNGIQWTYKYDGQGRRVEKSSGTAPSQIIRYVYDRDNIQAMLDGNDDLILVFTNGPGIDDPLLMRDLTGKEYSIHSDPLGSVIAHADSSGNVVERVVYEAYGRPRFADFRSSPTEADHSLTGSPLAYTGREWEVERAEYHYRGRQVYDPSNGRFGQQDPIGISIGDENLFSYVRNGPIAAKDPYGLYITRHNCTALRQLVELDYRSGPIGVLYSKDFNAVYSQELQFLDEPFQSVAGPINIDWMLRTAFFGLGANPFTSAGLFVCGKVAWNTVSDALKLKLGNPFRDMTNPAYSSAPWMASYWMLSGRKLGDLFAPALDQCNRY